MIVKVYCLGHAHGNFLVLMSKMIGKMQILSFTGCSTNIILLIWKFTGY